MHTYVVRVTCGVVWGRCLWFFIFLSCNCFEPLTSPFLFPIHPLFPSPMGNICAPRLVRSSEWNSTWTHGGVSGRRSVCLWHATISPFHAVTQGARTEPVPSHCFLVLHVGTPNLPCFLIPPSLSLYPSFSFYMQVHPVCSYPPRFIFILVFTPYYSCGLVLNYIMALVFHFS